MNETIFNILNHPGQPCFTISAICRCAECPFNGTLLSYMCGEVVKRDAYLRRMYGNVENWNW